MGVTPIKQPMTDKEVTQLCINTIRTLAMDAAQQANCGHPGPMALAPVVYCLWQRFLRFDPNHPIWPNRGWHGSRREIGRVGWATFAEQHCAAKRRREKSQRQRGVGLTRGTDQWAIFSVRATISISP